MHQPYASPYATSPQYAAVAGPSAPVATKPKFPLVSFILALLAGFVGMIAFLIAGFEGHRAGWELMAIPTLITFGLALPAFIGSIRALVRRSWVGGFLTMAASGFGSLLALVGFVLGA